MLYNIILAFSNTIFVPLKIVCLNMKCFVTFRQLGKKKIAIIVGLLFLLIVLTSMSMGYLLNGDKDSQQVPSSQVNPPQELEHVDIWLNGEVEDYIAISFGGTSKSTVPSEKIVTVYLVFKKDLEAPLVLKAFDKNDMEIGRAEVSVAGIADDARYVDFNFDVRTPLTNLAYCGIQFKNQQ